MMRSLSSAVGGLRAHQTKMDVIGTNIANVNTYGFKSSRVTFSDVYYQTLSSGSAPMNTMGGTNPTQIGYGAMVATIDVLNAQSGLASTDRALDVYINGDGMLAVKDANGNLFYTRLGVLGFDAEGNLVDPNGNYVMGFPMNADGTLAINPDGSVDVEDLSRITVDPEMLDQMTNISIGPNGEIVGIMPGDVTVSTSKNLPAWLESVGIVNNNPNIVGDVKVSMQYISKTLSDNTADWITSVTPAVNSQADGTYEFTLENGEIRAVNVASGEVLTGAYKKGAAIDLTDASGKKILTITTDPYSNETAIVGAAGSIDLESTLMLSVSYTDKGGNVYSGEDYTIEYDMASTSVTIGDIVLTLNPDAVEEIMKTDVAFNTAAANTFYNDGAGWLKGITVPSDSTMSLPTDGELHVAAGIAQTVTQSFTANSALKFMCTNDAEKAAFQNLIKEIGLPGSYTVDTESDNSGGFKLKLYNGTGSARTLVAETDWLTEGAQDVEFTTLAAYGGNTFKVGATDTSLFKVSTSLPSSITTTGATGLSALFASNPGAYSLAITESGSNYNVDVIGPDGTPLHTFTGISSSAALSFTVGGTAYDLGTLSGVTGLPTGGGSMSLPLTQSTLSLSSSAFANLTPKNVLQLRDKNGDILNEVTYNNASVVKLGDLSVKVDKEKLAEFFKSNTDLAEDNVVMVGELTRAPENDWLYESNAANAQPGIGESVMIGNIALAKIPNMVAMEQMGTSYFTTSANSGEATFVKPGINNTGTLTSGYLEMSNVDISKEFTDMITTQRGFQANTRIITVSDEMLQELVNLKR